MQRNTITAVAYAASLLALAYSALWTSRLYCEGFGCTGVGIIWMGWVALYGTLLLFGFIIRRRSEKGSRRAQIVQASIGVQAVMGVTALAYWLTR